MYAFINDHPIHKKGDTPCKFGDFSPLRCRQPNTPSAFRGEKGYLRANHAPYLFYRWVRNEGAMSVPFRAEGWGGAFSWEAALHVLEQIA
jgi:hypothetical protein